MQDSHVIIGNLHNSHIIQMITKLIPKLYMDY